MATSCATTTADEVGVGRAGVATSVPGSPCRATYRRSTRDGSDGITRTPTLEDVDNRQEVREFLMTPAAPTKTRTPNH
jgi:hypothetical protein